MAQKDKKSITQETLDNPNFVVVNNPIASAKFVKERNDDTLEVRADKPDRAVISLYQYKLFYDVLSKVKHADIENGDAWVELNIRDFVDSIDVKPYKHLYKHLKEATGEMVTTLMEIVNEDGDEIQFGVFSKAIHQKGDGRIRIRIDEELVKLALKLKENQFFSFQKDNILRLKGLNSIKLYIFLKKWANKGTVEFELEFFKRQTGCDKKAYDRFYNLEQRILKPAQLEINDKNDISFEYEAIRENPRNAKSQVIKIKFIITKVEQSRVGEAMQIQEVTPLRSGQRTLEFDKEYIPSTTEINSLSRARKMAFDLLVQYGIFEGIAFKQLLPGIKGSTFDGFEDYFVKHAIAYFEKNAIQKTTKKMRASTFVKWWLHNRVFDTDSSVWSQICEKVVLQKKELMDKNIDAYENRLFAKDMTDEDFRQQYQEGNEG
jgi:Initiator Replication protein